MQFPNVVPIRFDVIILCIIATVTNPLSLHSLSRPAAHSRLIHRIRVSRIFSDTPSAFTSVVSDRFLRITEGCKPEDRPSRPFVNLLCTLHSSFLSGTNGADLYVLPANSSFPTPSALPLLQCSFFCSSTNHWPFGRF